MRSPRIALAIAALPLLFAACDRTPAGPAAPPTVRRDDAPPPPPPVQPNDSTGRGGGAHGSGG